MLFPITVKADHHPVAGGMPFFYGRTNFIWNKLRIWFFKQNWGFTVFTFTQQ